MTETEIQEKLITKTKNEKFLNEQIKIIESLPDDKIEKELENYYWCCKKLTENNYLDEEITEKRLSVEIEIENNIATNSYKINLTTAINELEKNGYIYKINNSFSLKDKITNKDLLKFLVDNYYKKKEKFDGYISRRDFKKWILELLNKMQYSYSTKSIEKQIDALISN